MSKTVQMSYTSDLFSIWEDNLGGAMTGFVPVFCTKVDGTYREDDPELKHCVQMGMTVFNAMEESLANGTFYAKFEISDEEYESFQKAGEESPIIFNGDGDHASGEVTGILNYPKPTF